MMTTLLAKNRIFLKTFFFLSGFLFASWASRIPTIKTSLALDDAQLGTLLFILPISSLMGLPFSGIIISKFSSRIPVLGACLLEAFALMGIGLSSSIIALGISLFFFAFSMRILNIAVNTQSVNLQKSFTKPIIGSFHGLWSVGGILGAGLTSILLAFKIPIEVHLIGVGLFVLVAAVIAFPHLLKGDRSTSGNKIVIGKPDPYILTLGFLTFFASICEGGMYDWSGVYFKEILKTPIFTYGYLVFMLSMASFRFISDFLIQKIGMSNNYLLSSILIISGISMAIIYPVFLTGIIGFCLVGMGTASIFPMTLGLAGKSVKYSSGMAISIVSTYSIFGMLIGPPLIGYLSHAFNLRVSFILFAFSGLMLTPISSIFFNLAAHKKGNQLS